MRKKISNVTVNGKPVEEHLVEEEGNALTDEMSSTVRERSKTSKGHVHSSWGKKSPYDRDEEVTKPGQIKIIKEGSMNLSKEQRELLNAATKIGSKIAWLVGMLGLGEQLGRNAMMKLSKDFKVEMPVTTISTYMRKIRSSPINTILSERKVGKTITSGFKVQLAAKELPIILDIIQLSTKRVDGLEYLRKNTKNLLGIKTNDDPVEQPKQDTVNGINLPEEVKMQILEAVRKELQLNVTAIVDVVVRSITFELKGGDQ